MHLIQKIISTTFLILLPCTLLAQREENNIPAIKDYIRRLDSLNRLDHPQDHGFMTSIADGIFKRDDVVIGGFGINTLSNSKGDTVYRIEYHDNLDINTYKTYYFKNDSLIYATLELQDNTANMMRIFFKEEIYSCSEIIMTKTIGEKEAKRYIDKTNFSLYDDGLKFLRDFNKDNRR